MSKRVVAIVDRGPMDKAPVIVWQHEIPILEAIHGEGNVQTVPNDKLFEDDTAVVLKGTTQLVDPKSQNMRLVKDDKGKECVEITSMREGQPSTYRKEIDRIQLKDLMPQLMGLGEAFAGDPQDEYNRLGNYYGMHPEIRETMVEHVYGSFRRGDFERAVGAQLQAA